jgi:Uma2 family endonuclease
MDMDAFMQMATTTRHNRLINTFIGDVLALSRKREIYALQSDCALVYWGQQKEPQLAELIDISKISDVEKFLNLEIEYLDYVQPDFMFFKNNLFLENGKKLRIAGQPDLIVEIWSEENTQREKDFKMSLYKTSPITEHWYIDQDSNKVKCHMGGGQLPDQCLTNILKTQKGLEFDLRYLAI